MGKAQARASWCFAASYLLLKHLRKLCRFLLHKCGERINRPTVGHAGEIVPELLPDGRVRVDMGEPLLQAIQVPTTLQPTQEGNKVVKAALKTAGHEWTVTAVGMGNPHAVVYECDGNPVSVRFSRSAHWSQVPGFIDIVGRATLTQCNKLDSEASLHQMCAKVMRPTCCHGSDRTTSCIISTMLSRAVDTQVDSIDLGHVGPQFESHPCFPSLTNTEFVEVLSRSHVKMSVWERGAGRTLACGTGACALVVAGVLEDKIDRSCRVDLPGGPLDIEWSAENNRIFMTGPAERVFVGTANA